MNAIVEQIRGKWWTFVVRGIFALAIAAFAFVEPSWMQTALVYVVASYFVISGLVAIYAGVAGTGSASWGALILMGIVQAAVGFTMLAEPWLGPLALAYLFAAWMLMSGTMEISSAIALHDVIGNEAWWIVLGIITLACGFFVLIYPTMGVLALVYTVGFYGIFAGISLIALGFRVKNFGAVLKHHATT